MGRWLPYCSSSRCAFLSYVLLTMRENCQTKKKKNCVYEDLVWPRTLWVGGWSSRPRRPSTSQEEGSRMRGLSPADDGRWAPGHVCVILCTLRVQARVRPSSLSLPSVFPQSFSCLPSVVFLSSVSRSSALPRPTWMRNEGGRSPWHALPRSPPSAGFQSASTC
jgi:hypothetical protein